MRTKRFHGLKRIKIRQTWNKYNLYNLTRLKRPNFVSRTLYQQKWTSKSTTRAYHGEQIREKQWERMFSSRLRAVVPMDHRYLAAFDGSEQAEGRGSGRDNQVTKHVPYMEMTFAPIERRLDTAIFRALFASSVRQARQFVTHGNVKVNGKKMIYPGYLLNPGDLFQVEPELVLTATGAPKDAKERRAGRIIRRSKRKAAEPENTSGTPESPISESPAKLDSTAEAVEEVDVKSATDHADNIVSKREEHKTSLRDLLQYAKAILADSKAAPSAKRKQGLRAFTSTIRKAIGSANQVPINDIDAQLSILLETLKLTSPLSSQATVSDPPTPVSRDLSGSQTEPQTVSHKDRQALRDAMREARDNPVDPSKPYATPWRPRPYMSPFAFIPRYLEVNQNICSAVYLRHPVARPGLAEVPTPFHTDTNQLAFTWYLRRR